MYFLEKCRQTNTYIVDTKDTNKDGIKINNTTDESETKIATEKPKRYTQKLTFSILMTLNFYENFWFSLKNWIAIEWKIYGQKNPLYDVWNTESISTK